jgi:hypothetical protein
VIGKTPPGRGRLDHLPGFTAQILLSGGLTYSQNFDSLASSTTTTTAPWVDNTTLSGWYASRAFTGGTSTALGPYAYSSYRVSGGENNTGRIYSFGTNDVGSNRR